MVNGHVLKSHFRLLLFIIYCLPWQLFSICVNIPAWICKHILTKLQIIPTEQLTISMITYRKNPGNNNNLLSQMINSNLQNMCIFITYIVAWMKIKSHTGVYCSPVIVELVIWRFLFLKKDAAKVLECFNFGDVYSFFLLLVTLLVTTLVKSVTESYSHCFYRAVVCDVSCIKTN